MRNGSESLESTLTAIVDEDNTDLLESFLSDIKDEKEDKHIVTEKIMQYAIEKSSLKCVQVFLDLGVKITDKSVVQKAVQKEDFNLLKRIQNSQSDFLQRIEDDDGRTALHLASELGQTEVVRFLLKINKSLVGQKDYRGSTPLHICAGSSSLSAINCMEVLLEHGADIEEKDKLGVTPLHKAASGENVENKKMF